MFSIAYILIFVVAFILGSIPWGVIISKVFFKKDIRQEGSGNIGTTNAMRSMGKVGGSAVFVLDFGKGLLSAFLGTIFATSFGFALGSFEYQVCLACTFIGCVSGHIYSPWLGFHGGKGIAVAVGALFIVFGPLGACLELALFIVLVLLTRYVSVGSIAAAVACPFFAVFFYWGNLPAIILISIPALLVVYAHRENISRLANHCENRIGSKKVNK